MHRILTAFLMGCLVPSLPAWAGDEETLSARQRNHWAWKPVSRQAPPVVALSTWPRNPLDAYVLAGLEKAGLSPAAPAPRAQLLRRATFDLTGLPPTAEEIASFERDESPEAFERVVDRLLASPHYGERWGRHWLDLARYAESNGYEFDEIRPDAWRYRDYVIRSFNADKPYDRFVREQLAGDELFADDPEARVATGFNLLGPDMTDATDQAQRRQNTLNDMTDTASLAFLGLTAGCARCHDHKFEPIPQADYYRLQAFFSPAAFRTDVPVVSSERLASHRSATRTYEENVAPFRKEIASIEEPHRKAVFESKLAKLSEDNQAAWRAPEAKRTPAQIEIVEKTRRFVGVSQAEMLKLMSAGEKARHARLLQEVKRRDPLRPAALPTAMGLESTPSGSSRKTFVLERGELSQPASEVQPGFPIAVSPGHRTQPAFGGAPPATGRRAALADWIVRGDNPLAARVFVNRLWQHHFGRGIVRTANDFGVRGSQPTHPELLDWLANEFVAGGWSVKAMHRLMLNSATYQQGVRASTKAREVDPDNDLFSRMNRLRLEAEVIRDSLLAASGRLQSRMGGPGVFPEPPGNLPKGQKGWIAAADERERCRRSTYLFAGRNLRVPFLEVFDLPDSTLSCPKRERSTTAPQALALLNAEEVTAAAQALADLLVREEPDLERRIHRAYIRCLGRAPSRSEAQDAAGFLASSPLAELCRALFNANEFVYLD